MNNGCFPASTREIDRARVRFGVILSLVVLSLSFLLGLALGLRKNAPPAYAADSPANRPPALKLEFPLPQGLDLAPIGDDTAINGRKSQTVSFQSARSVRAIMEEQVKLWESAGYRTIKEGTDSSATAAAIDAISGARYTMTAWSVPENSREYGMSGQTAGMAAFLAGGEAAGDDYERRGEIRGVPPMPGGQAGSLFSTAEQDGRSRTTAYTNPGKVEQNVQFYRQILSSSGWTARGEPLIDIEKGAAALQFSRYKDELTLLFSHKRLRSAPQTVVAVTLRQPH